MGTMSEWFFALVSWIALAISIFCAVKTKRNVKRLQEMLAHAERHDNSDLRALLKQATIKSDDGTVTITRSVVPKGTSLGPRIDDGDLMDVMERAHQAGKKTK